jgi:hypothetical protein
MDSNKLVEGILNKVAAIQGGPAHTPTRPPQDDVVQPVGNLANPFPHNEQKPSDLGGAARETNMRGEGRHLAAIPKDITAKVGPRAIKETNSPSIKKVAGFTQHILRGFADEFSKVAKG